jgi:hypothetical protein
MSANIYPLHIHRRFERRWSALFAQKTSSRLSNRAMNNCSCGYIAVSPAASFRTKLLVVNEWQCPECGERWQTMTRRAENDNVK